MIGLSEVARRLGLHRNTVARIDPTELPYYWVGSRRHPAGGGKGDRRYRVIDIETYLHNGKVEG